VRDARGTDWRKDLLMKPTLIIAIVAWLAVAACPRSNDLIGDGEPTDGAVGSTDLRRREGPPALDLVFVIDNSESMTAKQQALAANLPRLVQALAQRPGGLPSLHIGVISSNFGAGPNRAAQDCPPYGDKGRFLVKAGCGVDASQSPWLELAGSTRNFTGDPPSVVGCLAQLGTDGCGYEHPLQALRAALYDVNPENRGFLRAEALLGIVILSDEDDCSAEPFATIFDDSLPPGQASSLKCSLVGHVCGGQEVLPSDGWSAPLASCAPYQRQQDPAYDKQPAQDPIRRQRLINVSEMVDYIKAKKPGRPEDVFVSAIIGWDASPGAVYRIEGVSKDNPPRMELDNRPICGSANGNANAGIRLKAFAEGFGENGRIYSICDDFAATATAIGDTLADKLGAAAN
jgi:hypothetical protein